MSLPHLVYSHQTANIVSHPERKFTPIIGMIIYAHITIYSAAFIYHPTLASILKQLKWAPTLAMFLLFFILTLSNKIYFNRASIATVLGLLFSMLISLLASPYTTVEIMKFLAFIILLFNAMTLASIMQRRNAIDHLFDIVTNIGRLFILVSFLFALLGINLGRSNARFSGWSDNPNSIAMIITPVIIILFVRYKERRRRRNILYLPFILAGLLVLIMTGSRASFLWLTISVLTFYVLKGNRSIYLLLMMGISIVLILFTEQLLPLFFDLLTRGADVGTAGRFDTMSSGRSEAWAVGLESFTRHPVLGLGYGNEQRLMLEHQFLFITHQGMNLHSSYITSLVEIGLLGTTFFALTLAISIRGGLKKAQALLHTQVVPWTKAILPLALLTGALAHATFETWLLSPGNAHSLLFWTLVFYCASSSRVIRVAPYIDKVTLR